MKCSGNVVGCTANLVTANLVTANLVTANCTANLGTANLVTDIVPACTISCVDALDEQKLRSSTHQRIAAQACPKMCFHCSSMRLVDVGPRSSHSAGVAAANAAALSHGTHATWLRRPARSFASPPPSGSPCLQPCVCTSKHTSLICMTSFLPYHTQFLTR